MTTETDPPLVQLEDVALRYGDEPALEDVTLALSAGNITTLIGPNGAGKTSLLRLILGLEAPHSGRIERLPGLTFGYVPQRFTIDPTLPLTVDRFLALPRLASRKARAAALADVAADGLSGRALHSLSGGELQRVVLARALLRRPQLLVLDEPLQGVDLQGQRLLFQLIENLRQQHGFGVLMVSHDLQLVLRATDYVVCLDRRIHCHGRPDSIREQPAYRALFGLEEPDPGDRTVGIAPPGAGPDPAAGPTLTGKSTQTESGPA